MSESEVVNSEPWEKVSNLSVSDVILNYKEFRKCLDSDRISFLLVRLARNLVKASSLYVHCFPKTQPAANEVCLHLASTDFTGFLTPINTVVHHVRDPVNYPVASVDDFHLKILLIVCYYAGMQDRIQATQRKLDWLAIHWIAAAETHLCTAEPTIRAIYGKLSSALLGQAGCANRQHLTNV